MKVKELIKIVNEGPEFYSLEQLDQIENLPKCIKKNLDIETELHYTTCVNVYKCEDGYVGIFGVSEEFSDFNPEEFGILCEAMEYKKVVTTTYVHKFR